jgi:FixJ family two-component response regulator/class 3 adenylate cyclase
MIREKPVIMFVDDEPHNLAVFEAAMPENWVVHVFDSPVSALEQLHKIKPNVVVSDQRMPAMKGVKFLELGRQLCPNSVRILVTGYSDEDLIIESVRAAKVFDYIRKPWDVDELVKRLQAGIEHSELAAQREILENELRAREAELQQRNQELMTKSFELEKSLLQLQETSKELSCWVPPVVTWLAKAKTSFPIKRDLALLVIDIIGSGAAHGKTVGGKALRSLALEEFAMLVMKHGGYLENTEGDAAYANFGLIENTGRLCDAAMAVANEFRAALKSIATHHQQVIECGIGLHFAKQIDANVSVLSMNTPSGPIVQKNFYTSSPEVDLVHRIEKLVHQLPGSNIVMSDEFLGQSDQGCGPGADFDRRASVQGPDGAG